MKSHTTMSFVSVFILLVIILLSWNSKPRMTISGLETLKSKRALIYNRVPKTGSDTLRSLLLKLGHRTEERLEFWLKRLNQMEQDNLCHHIAKEAGLRQKSGKKVVISGHFFHIDLTETCGFEEHDAAKMVWINQLRDPVERVISLYFYYRTPGHIGFAEGRRDARLFIPTKV